MVEEGRRESGQRLRAYLVTVLAERGETLNISALARAADLERETVHKWFRGQATPGTATLERIASKYLDRPVSDLLNAYQGKGPQPTDVPPWATAILEQLAETSARLDLLGAAREAIEDAESQVQAEVAGGDRRPDGAPEPPAPGHLP